MSSIIEGYPPPFVVTEGKVPSDVTGKSGWERGGGDLLVFYPKSILECAAGQYLIRCL